MSLFNTEHIITSLQHSINTLNTTGQITLPAGFLIDDVIEFQITTSRGNTFMRGNRFLYYKLKIDIDASTAERIHTAIETIAAKYRLTLLTTNSA